MDPMMDLDREIARSLHVLPSGDFTARVRARIASEPRPPRRHAHLPAFAAVNVAAVAIVALFARLPAGDPAVSGPAPLPARPPVAAIVSPPAPLAPAVDWPAAPRSVVRDRRSGVIVSASEMEALHRLFAGEIVAPPMTPITEELSIPELAIPPIAWPANPEGEGQ